jgi:hypothetical protein
VFGVFQEMIKNWRKDGKKGLKQEIETVATSLLQG